jgi:hypothetical protein
LSSACLHGVLNSRSPAVSEHSVPRAVMNDLFSLSLREKLIVGDGGGYVPTSRLRV